jgi:hypothetical protein
MFAQVRPTFAASQNDLQLTLCIMGVRIDHMSDHWEGIEALKP